MEQDLIRKKVKNLKENKKIQYTYFSKKLKMNINSFYNFIGGRRNLSQEKLAELKDIVRRLEQIEL